MQAARKRGPEIDCTSLSTAVFISILITSNKSLGAKGSVPCGMRLDASLDDPSFLANCMKNISTPSKIVIY
jgi:hypothetical protein